MKLRRLRQRWDYLVSLWFGLWLPALWFQRWGARVLTRDSYGGIRIADVNFDHSDDDAFVRATRDALALIERHDRRRFRIVVREIRVIINQELDSAGAYQHCLRACALDFGRFHLHLPGEHHEWRLAQYAAAIVHEATHARLYALGFPYSKRTRVRIERICNAEERRFVARLPSDTYDLAQAVSPFRAENYRRSWSQTRREYRKELLQRVEESRQRSEAAEATDRPPL